MPKRFDDYIPRDEAAAKLWYEFEVANIDAMGAAMGMSGPDILAYKNFCLAQIALIDAVIAAKAALAAAVEAKKTGSVTNKAGIRAGAGKAKKNTLYSPAKGAALKIVDTHVTLDFSDFTPILEYKVYTGYVRLKFDFHGLEMMNVYCRLKGTTAWVKIAVVSHSPFDDHRPIFQPAPLPAVQLLSEAREYMIIGVMDDEEVGNASAIREVVFGG